MFAAARADRMPATTQLEAASRRFDAAPSRRRGREIRAIAIEVAFGLVFGAGVSATAHAESQTPAARDAARPDGLSRMPADGGAATGSSSASASLAKRYRQPPEKWPPFVVDPGVKAAELGPLPAVPRAPWHTPRAEALGRLLFFDPRLSASAQIACANCHDSELAWGDGRRVPYGHDRAPGQRNAMTLLNVAYFTRWSWDGRSASLQEQALRAIASPSEMNADPAASARRLARIPGYRNAFAAAFGSPEATPERLGTALAAFARAIVSSPSRFDFFLRGNYEQLTDREIEGLHLFRTGARCMNCHHGPLFSDGLFHHTGLSYYGRRFEDLGRYRVTGDPADRGKFRTPSLRDSRHTGPWMHNGLFSNFKGILLMYNHGIGAGRRLRPGEPALSKLIRPLDLTRREVGSLEAFLSALSRRPRIVRPPELPGMERARAQRPATAHTEGPNG